MAIEEVTFRNIIGEEVNLSNLVLQMIGYYELKREVGETKLTDFNEGSEIRNLLEAVAVMSYAILEDENEAGKLPFIELSYGSYLDRIGANPFINLPRILGNVSTGMAQFTLSTAQDYDYVIPAQTLLEDNVNELEFVTLDDLTIFAGDLTGEVTCECLTDGVDGNIPSGTLTVITETGIDTDLVSVNNSEAFEGGTDYEDDEDYRERLLGNVRADGFGTVGYYTALGGDVDGVHDVKLVSDNTYTRKVLVNGDVKPTPDSVLLDVLAEFSNVNSVVLGHTFTVDRPVYTTVDLTVNLGVVAELDSEMLQDVIGIFFDGGSAWEMEYTGLNIDEPVTKDMLYSLFEVFADVVSVEVLYDGDVISEIAPVSDGVLKLGTVTFNQTVV